MKNYSNWLGALFIILMLSNPGFAQNRNFMIGFNVGVGNAGFITQDYSEDEVKRLFHPVVGVQIHKRIKDKLALLIYPNASFSGNKRTIGMPIQGITSVESRSAFANLAVMTKIYGNEKIYLILGPEMNYLLWNQGSTFNGEERLSRRTETQFFKRINWTASAGIGYATKCSQSRKNAPVQIDVLWFIEFRSKVGLTNMLKDTQAFAGLNAKSTAFEISTGIYFSSKN